jgi:CheY-like chemotaxis protein
LLLERLLAGKTPLPFAGDGAGEDRFGLDEATRGMTILLVEDDEASSYAVARVLKAAGYHVVLAPDYREALAALDSRMRIDLMLTDVRLTAGTPHGFALGRMARMRRPDLRVLYLTGITELPESEVATAFGRILRKPIEPAHLLLEISRALGAG